MSETIYCDVDGVLLNFAAPFADFWNKGLEKGLWKGKLFDHNPETWSFGLLKGKDDMSGFHHAINEFHKVDVHAPLMHTDIPEILKELQSKYRIELVSSYPDQQKRIHNLAHHNIPYDKLVCNINDKLKYIRDAEAKGNVVIAIFEDGPHHLNELLPHYSGKIWAPSHWKYLDPYKRDSRIRFYDSPHEWVKLNNPNERFKLSNLNKL